MFLEDLTVEMDIGNRGVCQQSTHLLKLVLRNLPGFLCSLACCTWHLHLCLHRLSKLVIYDVELMAPRAFQLHVSEARHSELSCVPEFLMLDLACRRIRGLALAHVLVLPSACTTEQA